MKSAKAWLNSLRSRRPRRAPKRGWPGRDIWGIGLVKAPIEQFLTGWPEGVDPVWLDDPRAECHADPFAVRMGERVVVMTEHLSRPGGRGEIVARELGPDDRLHSPRPALQLPLHLSYPFVIEHGGEQYCIPETFQANCVTLFRATCTEPRWIFEGRLIDGFPAVDSSVVFFERRFWLFCTRFAVEPARPEISELHIWHADDLRGPWHAHRRNPVKVDPSNARPAGTPFVHGGELFRPAQDCERTYGGAVKINHVKILAGAEFVEDTVAVIEPRKDSPFPDGLHHLSAFHGYTFVDAKLTVHDALARDQDIPPPESPAAIAKALDELAG